MVRKENTVAVEHLGDGKGTAYVHHIISKEEFLGHGRMYARVVLPPGASVGWHQHVHDTEPTTTSLSPGLALATAASSKSDSSTALKIIPMRM